MTLGGVLVTIGPESSFDGDRRTVRSYSIENVAAIERQNGTANGITVVHACVRREFIVCIIHKSVACGPASGMIHGGCRGGGGRGEREAEWFFFPP